MTKRLFGINSRLILTLVLFLGNRTSPTSTPEKEENPHVKVVKKVSSV